MACAIGKPVFVLCFSSRTPAEPSEPNTVSSRALAGNGITLQTDTAYEGHPRFSSLFLAHNPFPQILVILLKIVVGESVSLTHMSWAAVIVQATVPRGIFLIFVA